MRIRRPIDETVFAQIAERIRTLTEDPDDFLVLDLVEDEASVLFIQAVRCGDGCHVEVAFDMEDFGWEYPLILGAEMEIPEALGLLHRLCVDGETPDDEDEAWENFRDMGFKGNGEEEDEAEPKPLRVTKDEVRGAYKYYGLFYTRPDHVITALFVLKSEDPDEAVVLYDFVNEEWDTMSRGEFEDLLCSEELREKLSEEREMHALWYLEQKHAFNGEGDDAAVEALLKAWTEKKEDYRAGFNYGWPAKYVETTFYLNGKQYIITPDSIGLKRGDCWDEGLLEYLQGDIGEDLKKMGATEIRHVGFLD